MADTGGLGFQPVLHNITPEQVVFCYREGDGDSLDVARHYQTARSVPEGNLISLDPPNIPIISELDYINTIETPLIEAIEGLGNTFDSTGLREIWAIIMGYNLPHAFLRSDDPYGDPIAIASRLHRLGHTVNYKGSNFTYDRRGDWKFFDLDDSKQMFITAVIDAPTYEAAKTLIDRAIDVDNQLFITGQVYVDPYGKQATDDQLDFQDSILDFVSNELPLLGLDSKLTVETLDPYVEPQVRFFNNDSFYWGWFTPRYAKDLFLNQNERRVFLYNADNDAAADIKEPLSSTSSDPWCNIAINIEPGYATCSGAVAAPGEDAYLRARPFFEALHRGATIGEAFLFSSPVIDWKVIFIGDPLMVVNFPVDLPPEQNSSDTTLPNNEVIRQLKEFFAESLAWGARQTRLANELVDTNVRSSNMSEELDLLNSLVAWRNQKDQTAQNDLISNTLTAFLSYVLATENIEFGVWLTNTGEKISSLLNDAIGTIASGVISSDSIYPTGHWDQIFTYTHERFTFEDIHFELELHTNSTFTDLAIRVSSFTEIGGWKYEREPNIFTQMPDSGFPSNFSGRRIRYASFSADELLSTTSLFYIRWRALESDGDVIGEWQTSTDQKIIAR